MSRLHWLRCSKSQLLITLTNLACHEKAKEMLVSGFSVLPLTIKLNVFLIKEGLTQRLLKSVERHPLKRVLNKAYHFEGN